MTSTPLDTPEMTQKSKKTGFLHRFYVGDFAFDFIKNRKIYYIISAIIILVSLGSLAIRGLNLGIDFKGGSVFQAPVQVTSSTIDEFVSVVNQSQVSDLSAEVRTVGNSTVRIQTRSLSNDEVAQLRAEIAQQAGVDSDSVAYSLIGPSWGQQITHKALIALVVFLVLVGVLIWIYFRNAAASIAALVALLHDLIVTVGLYALIGFSVTPSTVIAVLTILGYSLYDTVVVFDMVREQTRSITSQNRTYSQAANTAINQALVRSINTTIIAILPVVAILIAGIVVLGGEGPLADLGLAMFIGMVAGAYSSICLATPLLAEMRERQPEMIAHRKALEKNQARKHAKKAKGEPASPASPDLTPAAGSAGFIVTDQPELTGQMPEIGERHQPKKTSRSQRKK